MANFSAVIIANNEEQHIRDCIQSLLQVTTDIILVDSGSRDATPEIASNLGARVYRYDFKGYGANKNYGNQQAKNDWIISIDGDEVISPELTRSIIDLSPENGNVYSLNSLVNYGGTWIRHSGWYPRYKKRIFNRRECHWNDALVHEDLTPLEDKKIIPLKGDLWHYSYHSTEEHKQKSIYYGRLKAEEWKRSRKIPGYLKKVISPSFAFFKSYFLKKGFLDGKAGYHIALMNYLQYKTAVDHLNKT